jgi:carboxypeptidase C (cathepsin A)
MVRFLIAALLLLLPAASLAADAAPRVPVVSSTQQSGTFNGAAVNYTATVQETIVPDAGGKPAASLVTIAYVRNDVGDATKRPVTFVFNGGPGASSSPLHMHALGPKRIVSVNGESVLTDNPHSVLDGTDLVFIDPIGTGESRPLPGIDGQPFWTISGDASSVSYVIKKWLKDNHRETSPHFLCGESYGASRAAQIIHSDPELKLDGVLLVSMVGGTGDNDFSFVLMLPSFAATAAFHGKVDSKGRTPEQIFNDAALFARTEYNTALIEGASLSPADTKRLAAKVGTMIGLPADFVTSKSLRVEKDDYVLNLLKDRGLTIGQIDSRVTGSIAEYANQQPPRNDPSMGFGGKQKGRSDSEIIQEYLTGPLKFTTSETYRSLNLDINAKWKFDVEEALRSPAKLVGKALKTRPGMRVFWSGGMYDLATPLYGGIYTLDHSGIPADRLTIARFPTGHMVYEGDENLARFTKAVRGFVTASTTH